MIKFTATKLANTNKKGILKPDADGYYELILGGLNMFNSMNEYYTLKGAQQLFESSSIFMRRVRNGNLKSEVGHPKRLPGQSMDAYVQRILTIEETNVCAHIKDVWLDTNYGSSNPSLRNPMAVAIMGSVKPAGEKGQYLLESLNNPHENVNFSIRALTEDYVKGGQTYRVLNTITTFDLVVECGIPIANKFDAPALENLLNEVVTIKQLERIISSNTPISMESNQLVHEALTNLSQNKNSSPFYNKW